MTTDIKFFRTTRDDVIELEGTATVLEKTLQDLIETPSDALRRGLALASKYSTGRKHGHRLASRQQVTDKRARLLDALASTYDKQSAS